MTQGTALITGASIGIGATYADRLARRGLDLVLVARNAAKLEDLAAQLRRDKCVKVDIIAADLGKADDLAKVEARLRDDASITTLVNNAGIAGETAFVEADVAHLQQMIDLNVTAVMRLSAAIATRLGAAGAGTIINITSVTALMPEAFTAVYPATKAFVLAFTEGLNAELGPKGVRVQAVLPGITRTAIWDEAQLANLPADMIMEVDDMVDAAIKGLDLGETVTVPSLPDKADLDTYLTARGALRPNLSRNKPAARYAA